MNKEIIRELIKQYGHELDADQFENIIYAALAKNAFDDFIYLLGEAEISIPAEIAELPCNFHIDMTLTPSYLRTAHFVAWLKKFNQLLHTIGLPDRNLSQVNINVEFSNAEKKERYGLLTIEELKGIIRDTWGTYEEIEGILDRIDTFEDYRTLIDKLMGAICRIYPDRDCPNLEELYSFLKKLEFEMPILGEYINSERLIVLYVPNIEQAADENGNIPSREFEKVFIHELFHAYHYADNKDELVERHDYTAKVVKESLASAFEWFYCVENQINGEDFLRSSWYNHSVLFYPYSGASSLLSEIERSKKFCEIFEKSLFDMDGALRALLSSYDFYRIKNSYPL